MWFKFSMETPSMKEGTFRFYYADPGKPILDRDCRLWGMGLITNMEEVAKMTTAVHYANAPTTDWIRRRLVQAKLEHAAINREIGRLEEIVEREARK